MKKKLSVLPAIIIVLTAVLAVPTQAGASVSSTGIKTYRKVLNNQRMSTQMMDEYYKFEDANSFAMIDLDSNGREELITKHSSGSMASQYATVYTLSDNQKATVLSESIGYYIDSVYRGGYIKTKASHNQGPSTTFWPYGVCRYRNGSVEPVFNAYCIDKKADVNGIYYKNSLDKDNDGTIYYISVNGKEKALTKKAFNQYVNRYIPKADKLSVKWYKMSESNISKLSSKMTSKVKMLSAPKATLKNTAKGVKISWKKISGAAKYRVFIKSKGKWKKLADTTAKTYTHTKAKAGKKYSYTVRCLSKNGKAYSSAYNKNGVTIKCRR